MKKAMLLVCLLWVFVCKAQQTQIGKMTQESTIVWLNEEVDENEFLPEDFLYEINSVETDSIKISNKKKQNDFFVNKLLPAVMGTAIASLILVGLYRLHPFLD